MKQPKITAPKPPYIPKGVPAPKSKLSPASAAKIRAKASMVTGK